MYALESAWTFFQLQGMYMKLRRETLRVAKFSAVGTVAFIVDFLVFNLLRLEVFHLGPVWAKIISVIMATTVSWLGSRYWTFTDGRNKSKTKEAVYFFSVNGAGLLIALACLWVSHYLLGFRSALADNISGNVVGVLLGNVFRYFMYRFFVFKPAPKRQRLDV